VSQARGLRAESDIADPYLRIRDAAHYINSSPRIVRAEVRARRLVAYTGPSGLRFKRSDLDEYMAARCVSAEQPTLKQLLSEIAARELAKRKE